MPDEWACPQYSGVPSGPQAGVDHVRPNHALHADAVSYTHLDVYKRQVVKWYFKNSYKIQKRRRFFAPMCFTPVFPSTIMLSVQQAADRMRAAGEDGKP